MNWPSTFELTWDPVPGARGYTVYLMPNRPPLVYFAPRGLRGPRWRKARRHLRRQSR